MGTLTAPSRRWRRKHHSRLSRVRPGAERMLWAPHRISWWIAILFTLGSLCFLVGALLLLPEGVKGAGRVD
jgi:hypothetical protein